MYNGYPFLLQHMKSCQIQSAVACTIAMGTGGSTACGRVKLRGGARSQRQHARTPPAAAKTDADHLLGLAAAHSGVQGMEALAPGLHHATLLLRHLHRLSDHYK